MLPKDVGLLCHLEKVFDEKLQNQFLSEFLIVLKVKVEKVKSYKFKLAFRRVRRIFVKGEGKNQRG